MTSGLQTCPRPWAPVQLGSLGRTLLCSQSKVQPLILHDAQQLSLWILPTNTTAENLCVWPLLSIAPSSSRHLLLLHLFLFYHAHHLFFLCSFLLGSSLSCTFPSYRTQRNKPAVPPKPRYCVNSGTYLSNAENMRLPRSQEGRRAETERNAEVLPESPANDPNLSTELELHLQQVGSEGAREERGEYGKFSVVVTGYLLLRRRQFCSAVTRFNGLALQPPLHTVRYQFYTQYVLEKISLYSNLGPYGSPNPEWRKKPFKSAVEYGDDHFLPYNCSFILPYARNDARHISLEERKW